MILQTLSRLARADSSNSLTYNPAIWPGLSLIACLGAGQGETDTTALKILDLPSKACFSAS